MIFKPAWALNASTSALLWRMISSIGRSNWKFTGLTLNLALASASGLMSCSFMRLLVLVCFSFHRRACLLGSQTTNRFSTIQGTFPRIGAPTAHWHLDQRVHLRCGPPLEHSHVAGRHVHLRLQSGPGFQPAYQTLPSQFELLRQRKHARQDQNSTGVLHGD